MLYSIVIYRNIELSDRKQYKWFYFNHSFSNNDVQLIKQNIEKHSVLPNFVLSSFLDVINFVIYHYIFLCKMKFHEIKKV